ncbi:MAG: DUF1223 domain-containing protein [Opitutus sp.]
MRPFLCWLAVGLAWIPLRGQSVEFASGPRQVSLIELFTSEGCSSCPPAEAWLGDLARHPRLWQDFVPISFHVDYWNRLGWRDVFSSAENTRRQYAYAEVWKTSSVYTPCFVRDGVEWRRSRDLSPTSSKPGSLTATYQAGRVTAVFAPERPGDRGEYKVHAAILAGGISSNVTAGENRGETLRHEFVAVSMASSALGESVALVPPSKPMSQRFALAVWITRAGELMPVQATGGWLE